MWSSRGFVRQKSRLFMMDKLLCIAPLQLVSVLTLTFFPLNIGRFRIPCAVPKIYSHCKTRSQFLRRSWQPNLARSSSVLTWLLGRGWKSQTTKHRQHLLKCPVCVVYIAHSISRWQRYPLIFVKDWNKFTKHINCSSDFVSIGFNDIAFCSCNANSCVHCDCQILWITGFCD